MKNILKVLVITLISLSFVAHTPYPIDGYERTGIKRLLRLERIKSGVIKEANPLPEGAMKSYGDIKLNLLSKKMDSTAMFLIKDARFNKEVNDLFYGLDKNYSIAVLDISDEQNLRYAARNEQAGYQPGSVGKMAILNGLFTQLEKMYPKSFDKRIELLKSKKVKAGLWGLTDEHTVPIFNVETNQLVKRQVVASDVFSLFEWADHMISVSNNGAASVIWREVILMEAFGKDYPDLTEERADAYFKNTPKKELTDLGVKLINEPLRQLGIGENEWRLGSFFTNGADKFIGSKGGSIGSPLGLIKFLIQLEQGKIVDEASSLEIKRLMYTTDKRIRYAQAPSLKSASIFFKSGSLYKCDKSKDENCGKYKGNVNNFMNSVAIIEHSDNKKYIVVLMSNVLSKNSASDHMYLAGNIDKIIKK